MGDLVLENVIAVLPGWDAFFYRTAAGAEIDLVLTRGERKLAVECKASAAPRVSRGYWTGHGGSWNRNCIGDCTDP
jgi:uncharacterized protein